MPLFVTSLNSGSNGNCYYIGNEQDAVLVDAGISCREIEKRMKRLQLSMHKVKAVFISHEHHDHIRGLPLLANKYQLPVYITSITGHSCAYKPDKHLSQSFSAFENIRIGSLTITPFPKFHDAAEPFSFIVKNSGVTVGVFTDMGFPCDDVIHHFSQCHAAFLETNYDEDMLERGPYPFHLKKRIRSIHGHLSNSQALDLFKAHRPSFMSHLFLSHLSRNNNSPEVAAALFNPHAGPTKIIIASRYEETPVYTICQPTCEKLTPANGTSLQLKLSFA